MEHTFQNEAGLILTVTDGPTADYMPLMGGDDTNPSWAEYLQCFKEEYRPHFELLKQSIIELGWLGSCADEIANDWASVFSDGIILGFSWRAWGDLMQAIVDKNEGYMTYYM